MKNVKTAISFYVFWRGVHSSIWLGYYVLDLPSVAHDFESFSMQSGL